MDDKIFINNKNLSDYVMFKLDKIENGFSTEELNKISEVVIDFNDEEESIFVLLEELLKFNNLYSLTIRSAFIYNDNYNIFLKLSKLKDIVFEKCDFENADLISSLDLKSLSLIDCNINNYSFVGLLTNLEELTIINGKIEISKINLLKKLTYLQLSYSNIIDNEELSLNNLVKLYIDNTNIDNLDFIRNMNNIETFSIDQKQYDNNRGLIRELQDKGILVLNESIIEFDGE